MSHFITEQIRYLHEEIEFIEKAIADLIEEKADHSNKRILYDYAIYYLIEKIQNKSQILLKFYQDDDELKKEEMRFLAGKTNNEGKDDVWKNYYERIKYIKDYHKKNNIKKVEINSKSYKTEALKYNNLKSAFYPSEKNGRYVDMSQLYNEFINIRKIKQFRISVFRKKEIASLKKNNDSLKNGIQNINKKNETNEFKEIDMLKYLNNFTRFSYIPRYCKYKNEEYKTYLKNLKDYLVSFFSKINILLDCEKTLKKYEQMFLEKFKKKEINKWENYTHTLDYYCKYNDKLFASEGTYNGYIKSKKYQQDVKKYENKNYTKEQEEQIKKKIEEEDMEMAKSEYLIEIYKNLLHNVIQKTIHRIQRKQSFTLEELQKKMKSGKKRGEEKLLSLCDKNMRSDNETELIYNKSPSVSSYYDSSEYSEIDDENEKDEKEDSEDEDENNKPIYNPLNLPLGYDNKPIPYWLYKLHGLSKEYKCEICGNHSYFGRVAFEKHFNEWRHSFGMKCLKIPNTRHFKEITKIEDALVLYEKLKKQSQAYVFQPDQEIECEDARGNVMNMKTYDDLKRQGLI